MRIVSLVPSATETLFALGAADEVIAVTHECDHPEEARALPKVTRDALAPGLSAGEVDAAVRERTERGESIYELDAEALVELRPDLILTQQLCTVCAVSHDDVRAIAQERIPGAQVLSTDPRTFGEVMGDVERIAEVIDRWSEGESLLEDAAERVDAVQEAVAGAPAPRVAALEWLDPPFVAGHWTPQLIEWAGGEDVLGFAGEPSATTDWETVAASRPDVVLVMPCGYDARRAREEAEAFRDRLDALGARQVVAVDASGLFSRPGPRLVDGLELLGHLLHPDRVPAPPAVADRALELA